MSQNMDFYRELFLKFVSEANAAAIVSVDEVRARVSKTHRYVVTVTLASDCLPGDWSRRHDLVHDMHKMASREDVDLLVT